MSRTVFLLFHCNVRNTIAACQLPGLGLIPAICRDSTTGKTKSAKNAPELMFLAIL